MATAQEFVVRVSSIAGVAGCVLVRADGEIFGTTLEDPDLYAALMIPGGNGARSIMAKMGLNHCRYLSYLREGREHFYLFPIDRFFLGVVQTPEAGIPEMLQEILRLIGRVKTSGASVGA
jgi:hypothetical protein